MTSNLIKNNYSENVCDSDRLNNSFERKYHRV